MNLPSYFISCDWGTSNFRLRAVDTATFKVLSEFTSDEGIKKRFQKFNEQESFERKEFFLSYLMEQVTKLKLADANKTVIVASGMMSSSIGMKELPYGNMPFAFTGFDLLKEMIEFPDAPNLILVSGVKTDNDVMRGEEVQSIGIANQLPMTDTGILILPGTHSKHINFKNGRFENFKTFMTGELFEVISQHSILAATTTHAVWDDSYEDVFLSGVKKGLSNGLMEHLFAIRANSLLNGVSSVENSFFLSGLLIGSELSGLVDKNEKVFLGATGIYSKLYRLALTYFLSQDDLICFNSSDMENALFAGQLKVLKTYVS